MRSAVVLLLLAAARPAAADDDERVSLRYQATVGWQAHPGFAARFGGANSLPAHAETATSVVMDLFAGARPWPGAELHVTPELAGGKGLGSTLGVAAFPSGEVYRVGDPAPALVLGRALLRQVIGLGGGRVEVEAGPTQLAGTRDRDALTMLAGKLATTDVFDVNPLSSDPHTRFASWGLWASAAYDYPADMHGYTVGAAVDLALSQWSVRAGAFLEPRVANGSTLEEDPSRSRGVVGEVERRWALSGRAGAARALVFRNTAPMGSYRAAVAAAPSAPEIASTRAPGRTKTGFAASANQELGDGLGAFARVSANDGANESWAFTEIDRSFAAGVVQSGARWRRPRDEAGAGAVVSGLSGPHRRYLAAGGLGFLLGDGALDYAPELVGELWYRVALTRELSAVVSWQPILHPGFDAARGPVHVFGARLHAEL